MTIPISTLKFPTRWVIGIFIGLSVALPGLAAEEPARSLPREGVCLGNLYAGTLDNHLAIRLSLVRQGERLNGALYYENDEHYDAAANRYQSLRLEGKLDKDGRFVLTETNPGKVAESRVTGRFIGAFDAEGKASGTWETPAGDQKLSFHVNPTDSLEQGRNPRFRMRFEPESSSKAATEDAKKFGKLDDGSELARVWLSIEGGKELLLTGPDNEAASPCFPSEQYIEQWKRFNLESIQVRKLNGQPDLYWMSYDLKSQEWRGYQVDRRHRVVRASNFEQSLFDEWTEEGEMSGSFNAYADWWEDYVITHQGATLRVMNVKSDDRGTGDNEDCHMCVEEHENCPAFCEGFVCTQPGAKAMERCEEVCLRNCQRKDWVEECYAGKETQKSYIRKRIREIDVQTGLVKSDHRFQLNDFIPGWYRCSGKAKAHLHFHVLDDGISGWLLVRDQPLFGQNGETPKRTQFDPENPGQIPAIATCWLYNRVPWDKANSTRPYPPAPPDQAPNDHLTPKHCCVVKTSADGKRTSIHENLEDKPDHEEKAGRLLAVFDSPTQACYSANLAQAGRWGKPLVQSIPPEERITLALGAVHTAQDPKSEEVHTFLDDKITRLPIGTVVLVLGQSAPTSRIDEVEDHWYYVSAPKGIFGWAFGGQLAPFDPARPEAGYRKIIEHYQSSNSHSPEEQADFQAFLGRLLGELPKSVVKAGGTKEDPLRLLKRFEEHAQACRKPLPDPNGGPIKGEAVVRQGRITAGTGVRLRPNAFAVCGFLARLPVGTVVSVVGSTVLTDHIDGVADHWYRVETAEGQTGWIFGGLLLPFDRFHPEQAYSQILNRYQTTRTGSLREALELTGFLAQPRSHLPEALLPDVELAKLQAAGHILSHSFSCGDGDLPPKYALSLADAPWLRDRLADVMTNIQPVWEGGPPQVNPEAFWVLVDRYRNQPVMGERLAWAVANRVDPVEEKIAHECGSWDEGTDYSDEVMAPEEIESLAKNPFVRYVGLYPNGAHASAAAEAILAELEGKVVPDPKGQVRFTAESVRDPELASYICAEGFRKGLKTTLKALEPLQDTKVATARERIKKLLGVSCPSRGAEIHPGKTPRSNGAETR